MGLFVCLFFQKCQASLCCLLLFLMTVSLHACCALFTSEFFLSDKNKSRCLIVFIQFAWCTVGPFNLKTNFVTS